MFLDEEKGKNYLFHILNSLGKKFTAKILVPEKRKNGEPIILSIVENFIQTPKVSQELNAEDSNNSTGYIKGQPNQTDKEFLKANTEKINEILYTKDAEWIINGFWRFDSEEYDLFIYQATPTTMKSKYATIVFRERIEF